MRGASWQFFPSRGRAEGKDGQGATVQLGVGGHEAVRAFQKQSKQVQGVRSKKQSRIKTQILTMIWWEVFKSGTGNLYQIYVGKWRVVLNINMV